MDHDISRDEDPLITNWIAAAGPNHFSKLELQSIFESQLRLKKRFAVLASEFLSQSLFVQFEAGGMDKNITARTLEGFLRGRFDAKRLLQSIRDFRFKGKYFIPITSEQI